MMVAALLVSHSSCNASTPLTSTVLTGNYIDAINKFGANYCFFCSDHCDRKNSAICIHCGAIMCIAQHAGAAGCIGAKTMEVDPLKFECPVCIGTKKTETSVLPYYLAGSGLCRTPKIAWPLLLIAVQLKNLDSLVLKSVSATMESSYQFEKEKV